MILKDNCAAIRNRDASKKGLVFNRLSVDSRSYFFHRGSFKKIGLS